MKKHLLTFIILMFIAPTLWAEDIVIAINETQTVAQIQEALQNAINNVGTGDKVIVTGSKTDANTTLELIIPTWKAVVWQATYQSSAVFEGDCLIIFEGNSTFEVANGKLITANVTALCALSTGSTVIVSGNGVVQTSGNGEHAIWTNGNIEIKDNAQISGDRAEVIFSVSNNAIITVSGGSVIATPTAENAICTMGRDPKIYITGGTVSNAANVNAPTIIAYDPRPDTEALVHVSGNAQVEAKGMGCAIISHGSVMVSGNAQVSNNLGGDEVPTATIRGDLSVEVSDNAKVSACNNSAILCYGNAFVRDNCIIEAKENAIAIYSDGNSYGYIQVKDQAKVIAAHNYAIFNSSINFFLFIQGLVFAYGNDISDVINDSNYTEPSGFGVVVAWNKEAGNTNYERYSTDDIFVAPESATAYWDKKGTQFGISYANSINTGFIPLDVTVLSVHESNAPNITIYPNPTTGEFSIELAGQARNDVANVEIFDVYGRKLFQISNPPPAPASGGESHISYPINISHLSSGIYFVKVNGICHRVVKQ